MMTGLQVMLDCAAWLRARVAAGRCPPLPALPDPHADPEAFRIAVSELAEANPGLMVGRTGPDGGIEFVTAIKAVREAQAEYEEAMRLAQAVPGVAARMTKEIES